MKNELCEILYVAGETLEGCGEDAYFIGRNGCRRMAAVFDGCGGIGARRYPAYQNHTGAYVASHTICKTVSEWFLEGNLTEALLKAKIEAALSVCKQHAETQSAIKGSLEKAFPTTMAAVLYSTENKGKVECFWAGDSRCYFLNSNGLHQLTADDVPGNAIHNLTADGALTNVINGSASFEIHHRCYALPQNGVLFSATDGCFGYIATPMEFELLLLENLEKSENQQEWKTNLYEFFSETSGDDFTMCLMSFGFSSFSEMKRDYHKRYLFLKEKLASEQKRDAFWKQYQQDYEFYLYT